VSDTFSGGERVTHPEEVSDTFSHHTLATRA
jgi:hypothetical protein